MNKETNDTSSLPSHLRKAIRENDLAKVRELLKAGFDINRTDEEGSTPLSLATSLRNMPIIEVLISAGADLDNPDDNNIPPVFHAASGPDRDTAALKVLLEAGASPDNPLDHDGRSPLQQAVIEKLTDKVKLLIEARADVHYEDHDGRTALFYACMQESDPDEDIFKMLLDKGADPLWSNINGATPIYHARSRGISEYPIINMMVKAAEQQSSDIASM